MNKNTTKVLVTGAKGFIGSNLCAALNNIKAGYDKTPGLSSELEIFAYDIGSETHLDEYCRNADFIFHLTGIYRPKDHAEFMEENRGFTGKLLETLSKYGSRAPIMFASSTQASLDNPYGRSKKSGEDLLLAYAEEKDTRTYIYRFPNIFGKWCPDCNSVVVTFCHNIARDLPITVSDRSYAITLVYIDDVISELITLLRDIPDRTYCAVPLTHTVTLGCIVDLIYSFTECREELSVPDMSDDFTKKLYATYLTYLPPDTLSYPLRMNTDARGSFTELIRTVDRGQFSINITKPGIVKGNHLHNTKNEKFIVVSGKAVIRLRKAGETKIYEYYVSGDSIEMVEIPPGYAHNIENIGDDDIMIFMWSSECFDPDNPDTFYDKV